MAKKKDINQTAFDIVNELTSDEPPKQEPEKKKDPAAVKRGKARTAKLTEKERRELAQKAATARWDKKKR